MGRSSRIRKRRRTRLYSNLDNEAAIIQMKKHMTSEGWAPTIDLRLREFKNTGRGVCSKKIVKEGTTLIEIPYCMMVTYTTVMQSEVKDLIAKSNMKSLKIQDLLALFLVLEKHKNHLSKWKWYLDTLPQEVPSLPHLGDKNEIDELPADLRGEITKRRWSFESSLERVLGSINASWICLCCKKTPDCVFTLNLFQWGYAMVNTRAVYVDPDVVRRLSLISDISVCLSDEPCMALCPYLDMFNHSHIARTSAGLEFKGEHCYFKLVALTSYKKHEQIFISYGSHDNIKLLCEYGFFIPNNAYDSIEFTFAEVLSWSTIKTSDIQYTFLKKHNLCDSLYMSSLGLSFNLKAALFVLLKPKSYTIWSAVIYSENFDVEVTHKMYELAKMLLEKKMNEYETLIGQPQRNFVSVLYDFLIYRMQYITSLICICCNEIQKLKT